MAEGPRMSDERLGAALVAIGRDLAYPATPRPRARRHVAPLG